LRLLEIKAMQRLADAEIRELGLRANRAYTENATEFRKLERYCQEQRKVLRALGDLTAREQQMYELDNTKAQIMTVCKVALTNLVMWIRDHYFPASYAHATWRRLAPFFRLSGWVRWERDRVAVELRPFNDQQLQRDVVALCERMTTAPPRLPDGRVLVFTAGTDHSFTSDLHRRC
jgi:hypothetical protein